MSISLEALFEMAKALEVPPAYLLASSTSMADAVLALGQQPPRQQDQLAEVLVSLSRMEPKARAECIQRLLPPNTEV